MVKYVEILVFAAVLTAAYAASVDEACDTSKCEGPLRYYYELSCKPIYEKKGDCCAVAYNCDHLKTRSKDKCYYRGRQYKLGEPLTDELLDPCVGSCVCSATDSVAQFTCTPPSCKSTRRTVPGLYCYNPRNATDCCPREPVCVKPKHVATCEVDGKIYRAGESFIPPERPYKYCHCNEGYKGENVAPFCRIMSENCENELWYANEIANNYPPIYSNLQALQTSCASEYRYPQADDRFFVMSWTYPTALVARGKTSYSQNFMRCRFGKFNLYIGDRLSSQKLGDFIVVCKCQVPPVLTCTKSKR